MQLTKLTEAHAYLTTFERMWWPHTKFQQTDWEAPHLTGQAQKAYSAIRTDEAANYETVKNAILLRCDVTKESYWHRFRTIPRKLPHTTHFMYMLTISFRFLPACCNPMSVFSRLTFLWQALSDLYHGKKFRRFTPVLPIRAVPRNDDPTTLLFVVLVTNLCTQQLLATFSWILIRSQLIITVVLI